MTALRRLLLHDGVPRQRITVAIYGYYYFLMMCWLILCVWVSVLTVCAILITHYIVVEYIRYLHQLLHIRRDHPTFDQYLHPLIWCAVQVSELFAIYSMQRLLIDYHGVVFYALLFCSSSYGGLLISQWVLTVYINIDGCLAGGLY
jgi:hypothetical protein